MRRLAVWIGSALLRSGIIRYSLLALTCAVIVGFYYDKSSISRLLFESSDGEVIQPPFCNITCKDAISAVHRAQSVRCKNELAEFACRLQADSVYPREILPDDSAPPELTELEEPADSERSVRIVFALTVFGRDTRQVRRLLKLLYHSEHYFLVHVDSRSEHMFSQLLPLESVLPNVRLIKNRHSPIWGGATLLTTLLDIMKFALEQHNWKWDYFINLSETDLPIRPQAELNTFLRTNFGKNFAKSHGSETFKFVKRQGLDKTFYQCENRMWRMGSRELPSGIVMDGGSDWVALHRSFCSFLHSKPRIPLIENLLVIFNYTLLPAESFFHTVLRNSRFKETFVNNNLRLTNWRRKKGCHCQYKHIVDWCGCSPNVFRLEDISRIEKFSAREIFFARKFDPFVDMAIISHIARQHSPSEIVDHPSFDRHWLSVYSSSEAFPSLEFQSLVQSMNSLVSKRYPSDRTEITDVHLAVDIESSVDILVSHKVHTGNTVSLLESKWKSRDHFTVETSCLGCPLERLNHLKVSTEFDQKEELFRNYISVMGPNSEPALAFDVAAGDETSTSVVWIDSAEVVAGSFEVNISSEASVFLHKPVFKRPLRPGIWSVLLMYKWRIMARTKFLVLPFQDVSSLQLNMGPADDEYISYNFSSVSRLLRLDPDRRLLTAKADSLKTGKELEEWSCGLVEQFYELDETCISSSGDASGFDDLPRCEASAWSSYFPDLKATL